MKIFSNLNLNGTTPPRVQPKVGEWGPHRVATTAAKKRMRIWVGIAFVAAWAGLYLLGWFFYKTLTKTS